MHEIYELESFLISTIQKHSLLDKREIIDILSTNYFDQFNYKTIVTSKDWDSFDLALCLLIINRI